MLASCRLPSLCLFDNLQSHNSQMISHLSIQHFCLNTTEQGVILLASPCCFLSTWVHICRLSCSLFPLVKADKALNEIGHRLISTSSLLLVVRGLLWLTLSALKETVLQALLHVLRAEVIGTLRLHSTLFSFLLLTFELFTQKVVTLHIHKLERCDITLEHSSLNVCMLGQHSYHWSELVFPCLRVTWIEIVDDSFNALSCLYAFQKCLMVVRRLFLPILRYWRLHFMDKLFNHEHSVSSLVFWIVLTEVYRTFWYVWNLNWLTFLRAFRRCRLLTRPIRRCYCCTLLLTLVVCIDLLPFLH